MDKNTAAEKWNRDLEKAFLYGYKPKPPWTLELRQKTVEVFYCRRCDTYFPDLDFEDVLDGEASVLCPNCNN